MIGVMILSWQNEITSYSPNMCREKLPCLTASIDSVPGNKGITRRNQLNHFESASALGEYVEERRESIE